MGIAVRLGLLALLVAGGLGARWLWVATSVGAGFAAKVTCSLVFVSGQGAKRVFDDYVAHELAPFGALFHAEVRGREVVATALNVENPLPFPEQAGDFCFDRRVAAAVQHKRGLPPE